MERTIADAMISLGIIIQRMNNCSIGYDEKILWGDARMNKSFEKPLCEVIRFGRNDIVTASACGCNVGGIDFGSNTSCVGANNPECTCGLVDERNCV